jgi:hypothetical protein
LEQKSEKKNMKANLHIIVNSIRKLSGDAKLLVSILEKLQHIAGLFFFLNILQNITPLLKKLHTKRERNQKLNL